MEATLHHVIPYLAKKGTETSEAMRNPKLQKKALDYAMKKGTPLIQKLSSEVLDQLSAKVRPNERYKTDRKDLDGGAVDIPSFLPVAKKLLAPRALNNKQVSLCLRS